MSEPTDPIATRLAGHGPCYICGEQQGGQPHLGCTSRYGLNQDFQAVRAQLRPPEGHAQIASELAEQIEKANQWNPNGYVHLRIDRAQQLLDVLRAERTEGRPEATGRAETPRIELDNHHNALKCPYCNPKGLALIDPKLAEGRDESAARIHEDSEQLYNPVSQVYFRAGLIACREYMARFVEAQDPAIADSIRANWWPSLGQDYGPPRKLAFSELTEGEYGTPTFRCRGADEISATLEALPIALVFLERPNDAPPTQATCGNLMCAKGQP